MGIKTGTKASHMPLQQLRILGFRARRIAETVVTTLNQDGSVNAAPMGITLQSNDGAILVRPYVNTRTFRNLVERREAVINITSNPEIFFKTTFKEVLPGKQIPSSWVSSSKNLRVGRLRHVDSWIEVVTKKHVVVADRATVACAPLAVVSGSAVIQAYSRAQSLVIESIIHATRIKWYKRHGKNEEVQFLTNLINHYAALIRRIAANTVEDRTMRVLKKLIHSWNINVDSAST